MVKPAKYIRKVIKISGSDSPNVQLALAEKAKGLQPSHVQVVPGVLSYSQYLQRLETWDAVRVCVGVHGEFYEGAQVLLFPPVHLNLAEEFARELRIQGTPRKARAIGVDVAEGGDDTSFAVGDDYGLIYLDSRKTPDTSIIPARTIALMNEYEVQPENVYFDRGGGGWEHICTLNAMGYAVKAVSFGPIEDDITPFAKMWDTKVEEKHERFVYRSQRARMYHRLSLRLKPVISEELSRIETERQGKEVRVEKSKFAIPAEYSELRRQLAPFPLDYDEEGRIKLPPKRKRDDRDTRQTIEQLIGRSPDDADALVLMVHALEEEPNLMSAGGGWV